MKRALAAVLLTLAPVSAAAQAPPVRQAPPAPAATEATTLTARERATWVVDGVLSPRELTLGAVSSSWQLLLDTPDEWGQSWQGLGRRYAEREADVGLSRTIEASLGALWGEYPLYVRSRARGVWPRVGWALKTTLLNPRRDGHLAPAWARYAGDVFNNLIENTWLPPSVTTARGTALRAANGLLGVAGSNLLYEFWPDARRLMHRRSRATGVASPPPGGR